MKLVLASKRLFHAPIASRCIRSNASRLITLTRQLLNSASLLHTNKHSSAIQYDKIQIQTSQPPFSLRCSSLSISAAAAAADDDPSATTGSFSQ